VDVDWVVLGGEDVGALQHPTTCTAAPYLSL
jgi:hypothetical protein